MNKYNIWLELIYNGNISCKIICSVLPIILIKLINLINKNSFRGFHVEVTWIIMIYLL